MEKIDNEVRYFSNISEESDDAATIIKDATELTFAAMNRDYAFTGIKVNYSLNPTEYAEKNEKVKKAWLAFAGQNSGVKNLSEKKHLVNAFDNPTFVSLTNAIVAETILGVVTNTNATQIMNLANISDVDIGDSKTFEIETKGIPVAQRQSYTSNVTLLDSESKSGITVTPKVYTLGSSIDLS